MAPRGGFGHRGLGGVTGVALVAPKGKFGPPSALMGLGWALRRNLRGPRRDFGGPAHLGALLSLGRGSGGPAGFLGGSPRPLFGFFGGGSVPRLGCPLCPRGPPAPRSFPELLLGTWGAQRGTEGGSGFGGDTQRHPQTPPHRPVRTSVVPVGHQQVQRVQPLSLQPAQGPHGGPGVSEGGAASDLGSPPPSKSRSLFFAPPLTIYDTPHFPPPQIGTLQPFTRPPSLWGPPKFWGFSPLPPQIYRALLAPLPHFPFRFPPRPRPPLRGDVTGTRAPPRDA